jgi:hypothetical protein
VIVESRTDVLGGIDSERDRDFRRTAEASSASGLTQWPDRRVRGHRQTLGVAGTTHRRQAGATAPGRRPEEDV